MRVVAGEAKGRPLVAPRGDAVRPTTDRVREATFNALGSLGVVDGATVVDLFAGSGALGIEALSRGAAAATFVEPDRRARACIEQNLERTGLADRATVVPTTAERYLDGHGRASVDLALLDPPYAYQGWEQLLSQVPAEVAVCESDREVEPPPPWVVVRRRSYGTTFVVIARRDAVPSEQP